MRARWLVSLPFVVIVVLFALSNRDTVGLAFWPLVEGLFMPLYLAVLLSLLAGYLVGRLHQRLKPQPKPSLPTPPPAATPKKI